MINLIDKKHWKSSGIYCIENTVNGKKYIGSTTNLKVRFSKHKFELESGTHPTKHMLNSYKKYGSDKFTYTLLELVRDISKLIEREDHYIAKNKSNDNKFGYNRRPSAGSPAGTVHREDALTRKKGGKRSKKSKELQGLAIRGEKHHMAKTTEDQVKEIKMLIAKGYRNIHISKYMGIHKSNINDIKRGAKWGHITFNQTELSEYDLTGIDSTQSPRLSDFNILSVKYLLGKEVEHKIISELTKIDRHIIKDIARGVTYKNTKLGETQIEEYARLFPEHKIENAKVSYASKISAKRKAVMPKGSKSSQAKLNETQVLKIKEMIINGKSNVSIAEQFGVKHFTISKIRHGNNWSHLTGFKPKS